MLIFSPLLELISGWTQKAVEFPAQAVSVVAETVGNVASNAFELASFNFVEWVVDALVDWRDAVVSAMAGMTPYGVLALLVGWAVRKLMRDRQSRKWELYVRGDATWLQWRLSNAGNMRLLLGSLRANGFGKDRVNDGGGNILLVNAWGSGEVGRFLEEYGVRYQQVGQKAGAI